MSAGSLTLGGNLSLAVGPLGRNAEGSGAVNTKGHVAAMYSYSKTKGLFGGMSVEGSVIVERQDANRIAYGGNPTAKQILSGTFDPPEWADVLISELERCTSNQVAANWVEDEREDGYGYTTPSKGNRSRSGSGAGYAFGDAGGNRSRSGSGGAYAFGSNGKEGGSGGGGGAGDFTTPPRKRASSIFGSAKKEEAKDPGKSSPRPSMHKRGSGLNPFGSSSSISKRAPIIASSEQYNAGLTWDSDGPVRNGGRSRSSSLAKPNNPHQYAEKDLLGEYEPKSGEAIWKGDSNGDLLGKWEANDHGGLSASFARLQTGSGTGGVGSFGSGSRRSRSNTVSSRPAEDPISEDEYVPYETVSRFAKPTKRQTAAFDLDSGSNGSGSGHGNGHGSGSGWTSFGEGTTERRPFDDYTPSTSRSSPARSSRSSPPRKPNLHVREGLDANDGYPRAVALFPFKASAAGDLGLGKGDVVVVLDKVANGDWWKGRTLDGKEGIFPSNFIEVLSVPKNHRAGLTRSELKARMPEDPFE